MTQALATLSPPKVEARTIKAYYYQLLWLLNGYPDSDIREYCQQHREYLDQCFGDGQGKKILNDASKLLSTEDRDKLRRIFTNAIAIP